MRLIWNLDGRNENKNNRATFHGKFYQLNGAQTGPVPFHPIRIWVGALGPRMLKIVEKHMRLFPEENIRTNYALNKY